MATNQLLQDVVRTSSERIMSFIHELDRSIVAKCLKKDEFDQKKVKFDVDSMCKNLVKAFEALDKKKPFEQNLIEVYTELEKRKAPINVLCAMRGMMKRYKEEREIVNKYVESTNDKDLIAKFDEINSVFSAEHKCLGNCQSPQITG